MGRSSRAYLLVLVTTFLLFTVVTKGRLPVHGAGPTRILLPYIVLLLPYAGFLLTRLLRASGVGRAQFAVVGGCLLLVIMGTFDILRVFNYPARGFDTDAFYAGQTLRALQDAGNLPVDSRILIEKGDKGWPPFPIIILASKPERFAVLDEGDVGKNCTGGFQTAACKASLHAGDFNLIILSSREQIQSIQKTFGDPFWQIGKYHLFKLNSSP
jgi:hypothetical protein